MALNKNSQEAMRNWTELNSRLKSLSIRDLDSMMKLEQSKKGKNRQMFIRRIQQRLNSLHTKRVTKKV